jgi:hypothetical protein
MELMRSTVIFKGGRQQSPDGRPINNVGNFICDQSIGGGGTISGQIAFDTKVDNSACGFMVYFNPIDKSFLVGSLGNVGFCSISTWTGEKWINHAAIGDKTQLIPNRPYHFSVNAQGSSVGLTINGVHTLGTTLPSPIPLGQSGIWAAGENDIRIDNFKVVSEPARVFVVMQYTPPYEELYTDVILPVCHDLGLEAFRADQTFGPGVIISDLARQIIESKIIIADISPANLNVYYEVGYAHALNKPTILIAEKETKLPFDVSPFRVLFYDNSIGGKARVEAGLRRHIRAIMNQS